MADPEKQEAAPEIAPEQPKEAAQKQPKAADRPYHRDAFDPEDAEDTTWGDVFRMCCCHSSMAWAGIFFNLFWVAFFLYFFILGLEILGDGAQVLTGCAAGALFGDDMNPVSGLMIGIICTCFLQSSSTTTSIVVTLVGAGAISLNQGIYMVMGSNIGTSVTNTIVAMGQMGDGDQLERAFAGATVHDVFNILTVLILFPVELATGYLNHLTDAITPNMSTSPGDKHTSFLKKIIKPLAESFIIVNSKVTKSVAQGGSCDNFYPTVCEDPENPTKNTCSTIGLIGCPKDGDLPCPALFEPGATYNDDMVAGSTALILGILVLFICLYGLVTVLQKLLMGGSTKVIYKATDINGYLAMLIGALITMAVQSSSITTSSLTPLVGLGLIRLEQMFPMTLGANIGTCLTGLLAAMVTEGKEALQVALAHLFFNVSGIILWYPIPPLRRVPLYLARQMGKGTRLWKGFPILYILVVFIGAPLGLLGLSSLFGNDPTLDAIGSVIVVILVLALVGFVYWLFRRGGRHKLMALVKQAKAMETLPYDVHYVQRRIQELQQHTLCLPAGSSEEVATSNPEENSLEGLSEDMQHALKMVEALAQQSGLPAEEDTQNLGRFWHKEHEPMTDVDAASGWKDYQQKVGRGKTLLLILGFVVVGLVIWGLVALYSNGSTGYTAMGGLITVVVCLVTADILRSYNRSQDGKAKGLALQKYQDKKIRKMYVKSYRSAMTQIKADLEKLASHTALEISDDVHEMTSMETDSGVDSDQQGSTDDSLSQDS